jgi:hypothetical protein
LVFANTDEAPDFRQMLKTARMGSAWTWPHDCGSSAGSVLRGQTLASQIYLSNTFETSSSHARDAVTNPLALKEITEEQSIRITIFNEQDIRQRHDLIPFAQFLAVCRRPKWSRSISRAL